MNQASYWRAVEAKDAAFNGIFVYAVRSTGVYCRPSCPSRRPRQNQVVFFEQPEAAERAGYRPCRRCQPRKPAAPDPQAEMVRRVCRYIAENPEGPLTLAAFATEAGVSPHHLQRTFRRLLGITPRQYADALRVGRLKNSLREGNNVTTALYAAGYGSSSRLYEGARERLGMTPATYRHGGAAMHIVYTIVDSPLGRLLVAATDKGICGVSLGDSDKTLEQFLREEYPKAEIERDSGGLVRWVRPLLGHLSGRQRRLDMPYDVQATAFQRRVWEELRAIPYGSTRTYSEVARAIGQPTAIRAVARACATNPVPLVVPCHRVVREDGNLAGYRWGLDRKRVLIELERKAQPRP
ncbi:MAG: bifunctional DNA-binding transcriptional regulator/O6-methylguanine-DNA methyltransferase Ada [Acidobacteria bacterium]|nr:bifunctional DNA-binding transcriptional regulator/O6-methylguanine-DNA methyltransferase Ada [Acidobacteriota bacterium]